MSHEDISTGEDFEQQLTKLRMRIDLLPQEQRSHLYELAETIAEQHRQLHERKPSSHGAQ